MQLQALSLLINQALSLDNQSQQRLLALSEQCLRLECTKPAVDVHIRIDSQGKIQLSETDETPVNAHLRGPLSSFMQLFADDDKASAMINSGLQLKGNSQLLLELAEVLQSIDLDWEYHLAQVIGDLPAHALGRISRQSTQWLSRTRPIFLRHLQEFVLEEAQLSPRPEELEQYIQQVQQLQQRTECLEAKIQRLQQGRST